MHTMYLYSNIINSSRYTYDSHAYHPQTTDDGRRTSILLVCGIKGIYVYVYISGMVYGISSAFNIIYKLLAGLIA